MKTVAWISVLFTLMFTTTSLLLAQSVQTDGPYHGAIVSLPASGTNVFAGTLAGGVGLSASNGGSWTAPAKSLTD